jgi:hypothetical protein
METFYFVVLSIATVILILILTYIGIRMVYFKQKVAYPPVSASCPDAWSIAASDPSACMIPAFKSSNTGTPNTLYDKDGKLLVNTTTTPGFSSRSNTINFSDSMWGSGGLSSQCAQKLWATQYGITWDGISNYNKC